MSTLFADPFHQDLANIALGAISVGDHCELLNRPLANGRNARLARRDAAGLTTGAARRPARRPGRFRAQPRGDGSRGRPRVRSPRMLRITFEVPPMIV
jgi:hypothetical protein